MPSNLPVAPRVTVVVPLYNKAKYIRRCLESITGQSFRDFETLVVDDGSEDGGAEIAESFEDPRVRTIRQANAGPGAARNRGIREARGCYIAFLDADDAWLPGYLETAAGILDRHAEAAACSSAWIEYPEGVATVERWAERGIREGIHRMTATTPHELAIIVPFMYPSTTVVRASELRRAGGFQEGGCRFAEDGILWMKLLLRSPVYLHLEALAELYRDASALSGNYAGPRPVEPFLTHPEVLRSMCPPELRPLLERFYAIRAVKTACMLGYWGERRRALALLREFVTIRDWRAPLLLRALSAGYGAKPKKQSGTAIGPVLRLCGLPERKTRPYS